LLALEYLNRGRRGDTLRVAERGLQLALERGSNLQVRQFKYLKAVAIMNGALGRTVTVGAVVRPLVEDARRRLEASKHWMTKSAYRGDSAVTVQLEAGLAAGAHVDALPAGAFAATLPPTADVDDADRTCSQCGHRQSELKRCGA
jgi:hypothetical protein